jgi:hypothetical protein
MHSTTTMNQQSLQKDVAEALRKVKGDGEGRGQVKGEIWKAKKAREALAKVLACPPMVNLILTRAGAKLILPPRRSRRSV